MKEVYGTMALNNKQLYTTDDIMALPDGVRAELIDGEIYYMASPNITHQSLLRELAVLFVNYQRRASKPCETFFAPFGVFINLDKHNYLEPDLIVICDKEEDTRLQKNGCQGAPDLVIEIVSPSSKTMDYVRKLAKYRETGVREYWIVDPMKERVLVYRLEKEECPVQYTFEDAIPVGIADDFSICIKDLPFHHSR